MFRALLIAGLVLLHAVSAFGGEIRVVTESWPPYTYEENGKNQGVVTEIVEATLKRSGLDYSIKIYPWARSYDMATGEENVLLYPIVRLPNRENMFKWILIDGLAINMSLFRPKYRTDIAVQSLEDARPYRIGVTRDTSTHHFLLSKGFIEGTNLFPVNCEEQNYLKSTPKNMRIDFSTGDELSIAYMLREMGLPSDYWVAQTPLFHENLYMAFGLKTSDEVVEKVRAAFREIKDEGVLAAIVDKYYKMYE